MRVIVGTYRKLTHLPHVMRSLDTMVSGVTDIVFIEDSGDAGIAAWLSQYGKVVEVGKKGYTQAMKALCLAAEGQEAFVLEEDFTFVKKVDLDQLSEMLYHRPWLAQITLLRGAHFPNEQEAGGVIEACARKGHTFTPVSGLLEHTAFFSCNPGVWRARIFSTGWPDRTWSEEAKCDEVLEMGYRFGITPDQYVAHWGKRTGFGY